MFSITTSQYNILNKIELYNLATIFHKSLVSHFLEKNLDIKIDHKEVFGLVDFFNSNNITTYEFLYRLTYMYIINKNMIIKNI